jgi:uncharacterized protein (DUF433 family)
MPQQDDHVPELSTSEIRAVKRALKRPVGRYTYERASQLSGVPSRTLHHWAREGTFVPDFGDERPKQWSYRDLMLVRLFVWLRSKGLEPTAAGEDVRYVRGELGESLDPEAPLRSSVGELHVGDEGVDRVRGWSPLPGMLRFLDAFDMVEVAWNASQRVPSDLREVRGPNLIRPTEWISISPWVYSGEPCIRSSRLPTTKVWALHHEQGLTDRAIARLYPGVEPPQVRDAVDFEDAIRARRPLAA